MEDKTMLSALLASESGRLSSRLKEVIEEGKPLSEGEKQALTDEIENTLQRLQQTIFSIQKAIAEEDAAVLPLEN